MNRLICILAVLSSACAATGVSPGVKLDIQAAMKRAEAPILACYETALEKKPELKGQVTVSFTIEKERTALTKVKIVSSDLNRTAPALEKCVIEMTSQAKVGKAPEISVYGTYPVKFSTRIEKIEETKDPAKEEPPEPALAPSSEPQSS